ncbi:hypothetical protein [Gallibacter intestinalis]|uniref:Uncharacterized protein n=1 Tax=Gallibacter intestinalis TaxID=2779356 RepID=A0ABR9QYD9_9FIRM|nr:hypothetical protein [Gallibacter intestinalis]MBE5035895.1 hypothetical protein [Gallibacter intestinalis]
MNEKKELVIFETEDNTIKLEVPVEKETVWLSQSQMTELFGVDRTVITRHVNNVFKEGELIKESNVQKMHIAQTVDKDPVSISRLGFFFFPHKTLEVALVHNWYRFSYNIS